LSLPWKLLGWVFFLGTQVGWVALIVAKALIRREYAKAAVAGPEYVAKFREVYGIDCLLGDPR
jgi:hypothetical protein